ncbi:hypothetical protein AB0H82_14855 [Streptomyces sp. NPDC050732]|uniref:hypothetical protein n=1 Tax=Streptomyces sp. NPDC050732 TaxID=3154632 RepID=UPI0034180E75
MTWRAVRWVPVLALGALWWWGVLRLALAPDAGALEGAVAAGGWGLSVLPVHCVPKARAEGEVAAARNGGRGRAARVWRGGAGADSASEQVGRLHGHRGRAARAAGAMRVAATKAWRRRRWGGGSGPS